MELYEIVVLVTILLTLGGVGFIITKLPRTHLKTKARALLVDTSVLMDGRIAAVAQTGFIGDTLVIPRSVVGELQFLADHADSEKRARARYGLDIVTELQGMDQVDVELLQDGSKAREGVDDRLLSLAKQYGAWLLTIDYNLNKVAAVEGIGVLNINELAQSIRVAHLPGEHLMLELSQKGQDAHQAVGHLPDGTMVVVEQASSQIGRTVKVEIIRNLQTAAGKMIFAKICKDSKIAPRNNQDASARPKKKDATAQKKADRNVSTQQQSTTTPSSTTKGRGKNRVVTTAQTTVTKTEVAAHITPRSKQSSRAKQSVLTPKKSSLSGQSSHVDSAKQRQNKKTPVNKKDSLKAPTASQSKGSQSAQHMQNKQQSSNTTRTTSARSKTQRNGSTSHRQSSSRRIDHEAALLDLVERQQ